MKRLAAVRRKPDAARAYGKAVADELERLREDLWFVESGRASESVMFNALVARFLEKKE